MLNTAVLFLAFNRPDVTKLVFEAIRKAEPSRLYVAVDGPRGDIEGEAMKVSLVQEIATNVDWECEVKTLIRENNLGCKIAVSNAITWFFEHEEEGIILEDDCLPNESFFPYCQELLTQYRADTRIMMISGNNFQDGTDRTEYSYYFSRYTHIWGWATWRRAWKFWDGDLTAWPKVKSLSQLDCVGVGNNAFEDYWGAIFDRCNAGDIDTWDYPWLFSTWIQRGLTILPNMNLVLNIGFGEDATHTSKTNIIYEVPTKEMKFPLKHPPFLIRNTVADNFTDLTHYHIKEKNTSVERQRVSILQRLIQKIKA